jgi:hypothetical protein
MAILTIIIIPFSGIFVQSANIRVRAGVITRAGYTAQNIIEDTRAGICDLRIGNLVYHKLENGFAWYGYYTAVHLPA